MCTKVVLLLLLVVLFCCCASPASFESREDVVRQRAQPQNNEEETQDKAIVPTVAVVSRQAEPGTNLLLQILNILSNIFQNAGLAGTNCVPLDCIGNTTAPVDAGRCLTCLALVAVAGIGK